MAARVMVSPVIEPRPNVLMSKAETYCSRFVNIFPSAQDGRNASPWVLTIGGAADWTAAEADPEIEFMFAIPPAVDTADELRAWLHTTTFGDLSQAQRDATQAVFAAHGISSAGFTLATPMFRVLQRAISTLIETDYNFGMAFRF